MKLDEKAQSIDMFKPIISTCVAIIIAFAGWSWNNFSSRLEKMSDDIVNIKVNIAELKSDARNDRRERKAELNNN